MLDSNQLRDKTAIITGAGGEIGVATARLMLRRGARVVAVDRDAAALERLRENMHGGDRVCLVEADVTDEDSVRGYVLRARDVFGRIDVLVNNAGIEGQVKPLTEYPKDEFMRVMQVNVTGVFLGMKHVIPVMLAAGGGVIVNMSSTAGLSGARGVCAYNASKHAVIGLTRSAAAEWAPHGIRINAVAPGPIESRMMHTLADGMGVQAAEFREHLTAAIPAGRYGQPEEVATLVAFLASEDARFMHGSVCTVDGGRLAR